MISVSVIFRKINNNLHIFIQTVGKLYINIAFIQYLTVSKTKRKGYCVKAWLDSVNGDCYVLAENFQSENDAKDFIVWLVDRLPLEKDKDTDDFAETCSVEFQLWRRKKWKENHPLKPGKVSLMKTLF